MKFTVTLMLDERFIIGRLEVGATFRESKRRKVVELEVEYLGNKAWQ
jgi:hypothetical protein